MSEPKDTGDDTTAKLPDPYEHGEVAPDTEHARDHWQGDELAEHYTKPWAMVGRVKCVARATADEPLPFEGEVIARLPNHAAYGDQMIDLTIGGPWLRDWPERKKYFQQVAGAGLTPNQARALAQYLVEAADWADGGMTMPNHPFTRLAEYPQYVFPCDHEVWLMTVYGSDNAVIAHEKNGAGEGDKSGWVVELRAVDGRWEIYDGAAELAANTRDTTPAALEKLLNLHGVPT